MKQLIQRIFITVILGTFATTAFSQIPLFLVQGGRDKNNVTAPRQYLSGHTCRGCRLWLNNDSMHVYPTGAFAMVLNLKLGENIYNLRTTDSLGRSTIKTMYYYYTPVPPPVTTGSLRIETMSITPSGNLWLSEGDTLRIKVKGYPGCQATWINEQPLKELPASRSGGVAGYYEGSYVIQASDSFLNNKLRVALRDAQGSVAVKESAYRYKFLQSKRPLIGRTIDNMTYLTTSPEGDRLGPEKLEYLDKDVLLQITGRINDYYKVKLSALHYAYIPEPFLDTATLGAVVPINTVQQPTTWADDKYDYAAIQLSEKLPYASTQNVQPGRISVDVFGAYLLPSTVFAASTATAEIKGPFLQQPEPDVVRISLPLQHVQPWGYRIYYEGNKLIIRVKRQPPQLDLQHLTIGLDAGHGGSNPGSMGPMGIYEKQLTLQLILALRDTLQKEGAHLLLTRTRDESVANEDRLKYYRTNDPDLLVSIHLNASVNPVDVKGTATYYKQPFSEPLGAAIHNRLLETGLRDFKNNGHFNFVLVQPTEFPNILIETLFISNPDDETLVLDPSYRQLLIDKIVQGLKDFLKTAQQ